MGIAAVVVTQDMLDAAEKAGACREGLRYKVGQPLADVQHSHLVWFEGSLPDLAGDFLATQGVPMWACSGYGYGYGSGDGYGYGYGDGDGDGDGYGGMKALK